MARGIHREAHRSQRIGWLRAELKAQPESEHKELAAIYVKRGLAPELAQQVAGQLMDHDALGAHARDELGITETLSANPVQAAFTSAATFAVGASLPLLAAVLAPTALRWLALRWSC